VPTMQLPYCYTLYIDIMISCQCSSSHVDHSALPRYSFAPPPPPRPPPPPAAAAAAALGDCCCAASAFALLSCSSSYADVPSYAASLSHGCGISGPGTNPAPVAMPSKYERIALHHTDQSNAAQCSPMRCNARHGTVWHSVAQHRTTQRGTARHSMAQRGTA
jgi:hypothetical protein